VTATARRAPGAASRRPAFPRAGGPGERRGRRRPASAQPGRDRAAGRELHGMHAVRQGVS
jgi:hypothetical protein